MFISILFTNGSIQQQNTLLANTDNSTQKIQVQKEPAKPVMVKTPELISFEKQVVEYDGFLKQKNYIFKILNSNDTLKNIGLIQILENIDNISPNHLINLILEKGISTKIQFIIEQFEYCNQQAQKKLDQMSRIIRLSPEVVKQCENIHIQRYLKEMGVKITFNKPGDMDTPVPSCAYLEINFHLCQLISGVFRLKFYFEYIQPYKELFATEDGKDIKPLDKIDEETFDSFNQSKNLDLSWIEFQYAYSKYIKTYETTKKICLKSFTYKHEYLLCPKTNIVVMNINDEFYSKLLHYPKDTLGRYQLEAFIDSEYLINASQKIRKFVDQSMYFIKRNTNISKNNENNRSVHYESYEMINFNRNSVHKNYRKTGFIVIVVLGILATGSVTTAIIKDKFFNKSSLNSTN